MEKTSELPLVSVVTGYYNRKNGLRESIQSVLDQTYPNFEYIVFDDRSTDGTYELLKEFNDPRLKLIRHETNLGFTNGMINAINQAKGEYIAVHGSGDFSLPQRLEKQAAILMQQPSVVVVGCFFNNVNPANGDIQKNRKQEHFTREDLFKTSPLSHGETMYRKDQYFEVGGYRNAFKFVQDGDLWLRLTKLGDIYVVQETLYQRNIQFDGVSFHPLKASQQTRFSLLARYVNTLPENEQKDVLEKCVKEGIDSIISYKDKRVQKRLFKKFHTLLNLQDTSSMEQFVQYASGGYKIYYKFMITGYRSRIFKSVASFVYLKMFKSLKRSLKG